MNLDKLYITVVESSRNTYFAVSDGEFESDLAEFKTPSPISIQSAVNKALASYKDKIKRNAMGLDIFPEEL